MSNPFEALADTIRKIDDDIEALKARRYKLIHQLIIDEPLASNIDKRYPNVAETIKLMEDAGNKILYCQPGITDCAFGATIQYDIYYITSSGKFAYAIVDSHIRLQ